MSHLSHQERLYIENGLKNGESFKAIARRIGKSHTTVSREVLKHRVDNDKGAYGRITNRCLHRTDCRRMMVCGDSKCTRPQCRSCAKCNSACRDYQEEICGKLSLPPYVCNGCREESRCVLRKKYYMHEPADVSYRKTLSEARRGADVTDAERTRMGELLSRGLQRGQSVHHILAANSSDFICCEKTVYRYINVRLLLPDVRRMDLPMACRMKPRRKKGIERKIDRRCREGRRMADFLAYRQQNPDLPVVEIDSVEGCRGSSKVLMTMHFNNCGLLLAFLREANTAQSVIGVFDWLEKRLGSAMFRRMFPVCLGDNGSEFSNPDAIEKSLDGKTLRTRVFYCDPQASWQKGHVENSHLNLRKIFPKGTSFDQFEQEDVNLALSHVNSMARKSLNDIPAITVFETIYGRGILERLGITLVPATEVNLNPELLKK